MATFREVIRVHSEAIYHDTSDIVNKLCDNITMKLSRLYETVLDTDFDIYKLPSEWSTATEAEKYRAINGAIAIFMSNYGLSDIHIIRNTTIDMPNKFRIDYDRNLNTFKFTSKIYQYLHSCYTEERNIPTLHNYIDNKGEIRYIY